MCQGGIVQEDVKPYILRALIEANLESVRSNESVTCLAKLELSLDIDDAFSFKDALKILHLKSEFSTIHHEEAGVILLFLRDVKIHQAKTLLYSMKREIEQITRTTIAAIGMTLLDEEDTSHTLLKRLDEYFVMSKFSSKKKIFYGTKDFSFYESNHDKDVLRSIFKKQPSVKIHNLYKGIPVVDKSRIVTFKEGRLIITVDETKLPFYESENFTHLQHDLIPNIIRANIRKVDKKTMSLLLNDLEFLDSSPVERSGIRIEPDRNIHTSVRLDHRLLCEGLLLNISEGSLVLQTTPTHVERLLQANVGKRFLETSFQLPTHKNLITTIKCKATLFNVMDEKVILTLHLTPISKSKVRNYLSMQTKNLLGDLKSTIMRKG